MLISIDGVRCVYARKAFLLHREKFLQEDT